MLDQMPEREEAQCTQQGSEAPDWSEGEERFGGQRVDSSGEETPSADCLSVISQHLATLRTLRRWCCLLQGHTIPPMYNIYITVILSIYETHGLLILQ